jgi:DNA-binding XRE family transcriptional regulator
LLALSVLLLGGLTVVKPALDNWDDLYRADPFAVSATTQTVERGGLARSTKTTTTWPKESSVERTLGNSGLLFLRLALVALAAFLLGAVFQRVVLASFALRPAAARAPAPTRAPTPTPREAPERPVMRAPESPPPVRNGPSATEPPDAVMTRSIAMLVATRREELGLSQRELAKRAGVNHTMISRLENGQYTPSQKTIERLTEALRVDL